MELTLKTFNLSKYFKDASSTAIYGARGANGVVMITTKTGKNGLREIMFDASLGIATLPKKYDLLKPYEYAKALEEVKGVRDFTADQLEAYRNGSAGIDWQDEIMRQDILKTISLLFLTEMLILSIIFLVTS